jgi:hypothetical protein
MPTGAPRFPSARGPPLPMLRPLQWELLAFYQPVGRQATQSLALGLEWTGRCRRPAASSAHPPHPWAAVSRCGMAAMGRLNDGDCVEGGRRRRTVGEHRRGGSQSGVLLSEKQTTAPDSSRHVPPRVPGRRLSSYWFGVRLAASARPTLQELGLRVARACGRRGALCANVAYHLAAGHRCHFRAFAPLEPTQQRHPNCAPSPRRPRRRW